MSPSQTVQTTAEGHLQNRALQAPFLSLVARSARDLSVEYPSPAPDPALGKRAARALEEGNTHYVPVPGIDPLRQALATYLNGLGIEGWGSENLLVTASLQEARFLTIQMIGALFGHIALPQVVHPGARSASGVRKLDVTSVECDDERGLPTLEGIRTLLEEGVKFFYFESPSRLMGAALTDKEVEQIASWLEEYDAHAIVDQGLSPWLVEERSLLAAQPGMAHRIAAIGEAWPGSGLESWPVGYIGARADWIAPIQKQKQIMSICTSTPSQFAALAASELWDNTHAEQVETLRARREETVAVLRDLGAEVLPGGVVSFVAARAAGGATLRTLEGAGFSAADGNNFGAPGLFRLAVPFDETTASALAQLNREHGGEQS